MSNFEASHTLKTSSIEQLALDSAVVQFEGDWQSLKQKQRLMNFVWIAVASLLMLWSFNVSEIIGGNIGGDPLARISAFIDKLTPDLQADMLFESRETEGAFAYWFYDWQNWLKAIWETLKIAIISSVLGALFSIPIGLVACRNLVNIPFVSVTVRRILEAIRTFPDLILGLILVAAFGIGPLAGVITLTLSTIGRLGKLYSEINENADMKQIESIKACGGDWWQQIRYGLIPQVAPNYTSYAMLKFEGNIGAAAALGIIGAGGIGIELSRSVTYTLFADYLAILLLLTLTIFAVDMLSEHIRHKLTSPQDNLRSAI